MSSNFKGEKGSFLPSPTGLAPQVQQSNKTRIFRRLAVFTVVSCLSGLLASYWLPAGTLGGCKDFLLTHKHGKGEPLCPQSNELLPEANNAIWTSLQETYDTEKFELRAVDWLAGAVKVPTESYDKMDPVGVDPRWETFGKLHEYLETAFPLVHSQLVLTKHNTYGLLYEWKGSDASLKPLLLMGHQDVVPVDPRTVDQWNHPPYSGHFDGENIWGRGSVDDKSGLIGNLIAIESLLEGGFQPKRTVLLSAGFDEESSGVYGAQTLANHLLETRGENSIAFLVDEGSGFGEEYGTAFATPGIAEKGYLDTRVEVLAAGGHSSVPPAHTSIGILAKLLVHFEEHPYEAKLTRDDIYYDFLKCYAGHAKDLPGHLRRTIRHSVKSDRALKKLQDIVFEDSKLRSLVGTTQAIDLIQGGVKANALPEQAWGLVNHRINTLSSVEEVQEHDTKLLKKLAESFNLTFTAFGQDITDPNLPSNGHLSLSDAFGNQLQPAPITPTSGPKSGAFEVLSGTIRAAYNAHRKIEGENIFVSPGMMTGNTDTRYYWKLTENIFRYNHKNSYGDSGLKGVHTVNEHMEVDAFVEMIRFFTTLILNTDESVLV